MADSDDKDDWQKSSQKLCRDKENSNLNNDSDSDSGCSYTSCLEELSDKDQIDNTLQDDTDHDKESSSAAIFNNSKSHKESQATSNDKDKVLPPANTAVVENFHDAELSDCEEEEFEKSQSLLAQVGTFVKRRVLGRKPPALKTLEEIIKALIYNDNKKNVIISFQPDLFQKALHDILKRKYYTVSYEY
jgi:hypothetical protein